MKTVNKKGFTLIEVVLTIAIGALIFLLAFIAFRNAQVNRRDSQRRADLDKMAGEIQNYAADHNGSIPPNAAALNPYISTFKDPQTNIAYVSGDVDAAGVAAGTYEYETGASTTDCNNGTLAGAGNLKYKIRMDLEKGVSCRDSATQ